MEEKLFQYLIYSAPSELKKVGRTSTPGFTGGYSYLALSRASCHKVGIGKTLNRTSG
jgi:hypothetical protein